MTSLKSNIWKYGIYLTTNRRVFVVILGVYLLTIPESTPQSIGLMILAGNIFGFIETLILAALGFIMGYLITKTSYQFSFLLLSLILLTALSIIYFYCLKKPPNLRR